MFEFIHAKRIQYDLCALCKVLLVTRQGYHKWLKAKEKPYKHEALLALILKHDGRTSALPLLMLHYYCPHYLEFISLQGFGQLILTTPKWSPITDESKYLGGRNFWSYQME